METKTKRKFSKISVAVSSFIVAIFLTTFKAVVGIATGSLGIISEAIHSGMDMFAAGITLFSVKISSKPPDERHNFGHGKIENISAFIEALLLLATSFWVIWEAYERLTGKNVEVEVNFWSFFVIIFAIIIDVNRARILKKASEEYQSQALEADALHFSSDILTSGVVLLGLVFTLLKIPTADVIAAIIVSLVVMQMSLKLAYNSINFLLDSAPIAKQTIKEIVTRVPDVRDVHDIRVRSSGSTIFVDMNIHVNPNLTIEDAHKISHQVEEEIRKEFSNCEIHIHQEPDDSH
ncbi:cation transporter [Bacteroidetes/Chlorobi group bacterium Naka2016]|jgi:cation diffusion facilitator family transporter|nr:MAG: cation transporter [Bacteroidetes/Chlorobi group bacterium Naka2016]